MSPHNKDHSILDSILGPLLFMETPMFRRRLEVGLGTVYWSRSSHGTGCHNSEIAGSARPFGKYICI